MTAVERDKSKDFNSRGRVQRCSPACRSCENACRIVMSLGALKLLPKKLLLIPPQLLKWIQMQKTSSREVWSTEEEANMRTGHFWICKFGTVPVSMTCVEMKFELQDRKCKWEEYKVPGTPTGTTPSSLNCGCIGLLMICQDSRFRSGTPQRVLTTQVLRWQCSSTRASCAPWTSPSRK
jgi:hypothetical protein